VTSFKLSRDHAEHEAESLIQSEWAGRGLPIDPAYIARQLGAEVYEMHLAETVDGMLKYYQDGTFPAIFVNEETAPPRKRFTIAHELGHVVANIRQNPNGVIDGTDVFYRDPDSRTGKKPIEVFANQFAAALLMPRAFVKALFDSGKSDLVLANDFGVSLQAMTNRLTNLGLLKKGSWRTYW
jgi:Zn-dependent peptidase ImmA (M78 family)